MKKIALLMTLIVAPLLFAQHQHGDISRPRIGVVSEQVARQKLVAYGMDITRLERRGELYVATVMRDGQRAVLEISAVNGRVTEGGKSVRLRPARKALTRAVKPNPARLPWVKRAIRFDAIGVEGLRQPARSTIQ